MTNLVAVLAEALPRSGQWRFPGQREKWLEAAAVLIDMEMDNRQQDTRRLAERVEVRDVGPCGAVIVANGNGHGGER